MRAEQEIAIYHHITMLFTNSSTIATTTAGLVVNVVVFDLLRPQGRHNKHPLQFDCLRSCFPSSIDHSTSRWPVPTGMVCVPGHLLATPSLPRPGHLCLLSRLLLYPLQPSQLTTACPSHAPCLVPIIDKAWLYFSISVCGPGQNLRPQSHRPPAPFRGALPVSPSQFKVHSLRSVLASPISPTGCSSSSAMNGQALLDP